MLLSLTYGGAKLREFELPDDIEIDKEENRDGDSIRVSFTSSDSIEVKKYLSKLRTKESIIVLNKAEFIKYHYCLLMENVLVILNTCYGNTHIEFEALNEDTQEVTQLINLKGDLI